MKLFSRVTMCRGLVLTACALFNTSQAQPPTYTWAKNIGGSQSEWGKSIVVSPTTNCVYVAGTFTGTNVDFNPSFAATAYLSASGSGEDIFLAKYDQDGNYLWAIKFGGNSTNDRVGQLLIGEDDTLYLTGGFRGTADFNPSAVLSPLSCTGGIFSDAFIASYDKNGNYIYATAFGGMGEDYITAAHYSGGFITATGGFESTADFDPSPFSTFNLTASGMDAFVAKFRSTTGYLSNWARKTGGINTDEGKSVTADAFGNVYMTGYFRGSSIDFDPGAGLFPLSSVSNSDDIFYLKFDASGLFLWARSIGGPSTDRPTAIRLDVGSNVILSGTFFGTTAIDFDPGPSSSLLSGAGNLDFFVGKYHPGTGYLNNWVFKVGAGSMGSYTDETNAMCVDHLGNIYVTGYFDSGAPDFDPSMLSSVTLTSPSATYDVFFAKYYNNGTLAWAKSLGGTFSEQGADIFVDGNNNVYLTGYYGTNPMDFDPNGPVASLFTFGQSDVFVAKYADDGSFLLPVELIEFSGQVKNGQNQLSWVTASELGNDFFTVETSHDGKLFESVADVEGAGNSSVPTSYQFTDPETRLYPAYYRLKQTDFDGNYKYSNVILLGSNFKPNDIFIYPNPCHNDLSILNSCNSAGTISIVNDHGQHYFSVELAGNEPGQIPIEDLESWPAGIYVIIWTAELSQPEFFRLIKY